MKKEFHKIDWIITLIPFVSIAFLGYARIMV